MTLKAKSGIQAAFWMTVFTIGLVGLPACEDDSDDGVSSEYEGRSAFLRVIHLSPNAPTVDVFINGWTLDKDLEQMETSRYFEVIAGEHIIDISPAGASAKDSVKRVEGLRLEQGKYYTAFAYGDVADLKVGLMVDDFANRQDGTFRIRPVHAAGDFGEVDIWNLTEGQVWSILYENVPFGAVGNYIDLPLGVYTIGIDADDDGRPEAVFDTPSIGEGSVINLFAVSEAPVVFLLAQAQVGPPAKIDAGVAQVRLMHISPDAPAVDAWVNDRMEPLAQGLSYSSGTEYKSIYAGLHNFHIAPAGTSPEDAVLHAHELFLRPGRSYTVTAYNPLSEIKGMLLEDDNSPLEADKIRVRAIHTAPGVGAVDIWNIERSGMPSQLYEGLGFAAVGDYLELPVDQYVLGFDVNGDGKPDVTFEIPRLPEGSIANVYAVNDGSRVSLIAQLANGGTATIDSK